MYSISNAGGSRMEKGSGPQCTDCGDCGFVDLDEQPSFPDGGAAPCPMCQMGALHNTTSNFWRGGAASVLQHATWNGGWGIVFTICDVCPVHQNRIAPRTAIYRHMRQVHGVGPPKRVTAAPEIRQLAAATTEKFEGSAVALDHKQMAADRAYERETGVS